MKKSLIGIAVLALLLLAGGSGGGGAATTYTIGSNVSDDYASWAAFHAAVTPSAGDTISFRRGDTFQEQVAVPASGSAGSPVTYTAHGSGADPVIWAIYGGAYDYVTCRDLNVVGLWYIGGDHWDVERCKNDGAEALNFVSTGQTLDTSITATGTPAVLWCWGDGTTDTAEDPGIKDYGSEATRYGCVICADWSTVTLVTTGVTTTVWVNIGDIPSNVTGTVFSDASTLITGDIGNLPRGLTGDVNVRTSTHLTGDIGDLPSGLTGYVLLGSATALTGDIGDLPTGLTGTLQFTAATALTGNIGDLLSGMAGNVYLNAATELTYASDSWPLNSQNGVKLRFDAATFDETEVNNILQHLDATGITGGTLNIGSGAPPTGAGITAKNNLEVGKGWSITVGT